LVCQVEAIKTLFI